MSLFPPLGGASFSSAFSTLGPPLQVGTTTVFVPPPPVYISGTAALVANQPATSITIATPTRLIGGALLLAFIYSPGNPPGQSNPVTSAPADFTIYNSTTIGTINNAYIYTRTVTGTEAASYTWSIAPQSFLPAGCILQYNRTAGIDAQTWGGTFSSPSLTAVWPSATAATRNDRWVLLLGYGTSSFGSPALTVPPGFATRATSYNPNNTNSILSGDRVFAATGATGTASTTGTNSPRYIAASVLLKGL